MGYESVTLFRLKPSSGVTPSGTLGSVGAFYILGSIRTKDASELLLKRIVSRDAIEYRPTRSRSRGHKLARWD